MHGFIACVTAWKLSRYGVFSGPCFPVFSPNTGKFGPEKTPYLDTFHAVYVTIVRKRKSIPSEIV